MVSADRFDLPTKLARKFLQRLIGVLLACQKCTKRGLHLTVDSVRLPLKTKLLHAQAVLSLLAEVVTDPRTVGRICDQDESAVVHGEVHLRVEPCSCCPVASRLGPVGQVDGRPDVLVLWNGLGDIKPLLMLRPGLVGELMVPICSASLLYGERLARALHVRAWACGRSDRHGVVMTEPISEPVSDLDKLPKKLSPSRAKMFENCPKSFYFRTLKKLPTKNTVANTRGTLAHEALEEIFKLPREERTPEKAHTFVEPAWRKIENRDSYKDMVEPGSDEEKEMLEYAKEMVTNAFKIENIRGFDAGALEYHAEADINGLTLHGYIDRLDEAPVNGEPRAFISDYKGLALSTPLPTPSGWTTMADVLVGDKLIGADGSETRVVSKSQIHNRPCYRIEFMDGTFVECDNEHLWRIQVVKHAYKYENNGRVKVSGAQPPEMRVLDADALYELSQTVQPQAIYIDAQAPLELPAVGLPIDPWVLGMWLGDGKSATGEITVGHKDLEAVRALLAVKWGEGTLFREERTSWQVTCTRPLKDRCSLGHRIERNLSGVRRCVAEHQHGDTFGSKNLTLRKKLVDANLLNNKHVPSSYLRASKEQRIDLVRGLMDSDGSWNAGRTRAVFVTTNDRLATGMVELLRSLGVNPQVFSKKYANATRQDAISHMIEFSPIGFNPFMLPRKADPVNVYLQTRKQSYGRGPVKALRRTIRSIKPIKSVETQCVEVDASDSMYLAGVGMVPTHNTGKIPRDRYLDDAFFAMRIYALLLFEETGKMPRMLRLIYLKGETAEEAVRRVIVTPELIERTRRDVNAIWRRIKTAAATGNWPTKTGPLCNFCDFKPMCPAFGGEG